MQNTIRYLISVVDTGGEETNDGIAHDHMRVAIVDSNCYCSIVSLWHGGNGFHYIARITGR